LQARLVEVLLVLLPAVVVGVDLTEVGVHLGIDIAVGLYLAFDFVEDLQAVVMQAQVELLFRLGDAAQIHGVLVGLEAHLGLIQESDRRVDVGVLTRGKHGQLGVLDRVDLVGEPLDKRLIQGEQVGVLTLIERLLLEVS